MRLHILFPPATAKKLDTACFGRHQASLGSFPTKKYMKVNVPSHAHTPTLTASSHFQIFQCASSPGPSSPRKFNFANHGNHMMYDKQILLQLEGNYTVQ